jgi:hypothetical protein
VIGYENNPGCCSGTGVGRCSCTGFVLAGHSGSWVVYLPIVDFAGKGLWIGGENLLVGSSGGSGSLGFVPGKVSGVCIGSSVAMVPVAVVLALLQRRLFGWMVLVSAVEVLTCILLGGFLHS